jgi:hypothetical protein
MCGHGSVMNVRAKTLHSSVATGCFEFLIYSFYEAPAPVSYRQ